MPLCEYIRSTSAKVTHHNLENSGHRPWNCGRIQSAGYSSGSKSSRLIIVKYFSSWVSGESVGCWRFSTGVLNCLGLEAQDQDSKGKTKTKTMRVKTKTVTLKTKTKAVKILPRDEAVPRGFPSLTTDQCSQLPGKTRL